MENQHRKISGYRELDEAEIELMNEVKALGPPLEAVLAKVRGRVLQCSSMVKGHEDGTVTKIPINAGADERWLRIAEDHLQQGLMALTRAIARPTFF